jgi:carboxyl-terminal processing protease
MRKHTLLAAFLLVTFALPAARAQEDSSKPAQDQAEEQDQYTVPESPFDEVWLVVRSAFYDPKFRGVDWDGVHEELKPKYDAAATPLERSHVINEALSRLHSSHTHHYIQDQREYYELLDVFFPNGVPPRRGSKIQPGPVEYCGIGLVTKLIDGHYFAYDVYDDGPADKAGIKTGDELISVEGEPWGELSDVVPFRGRENTPTAITIQRTKEQDSRRDVTVTPILIHPHEMFLKALKGSAQMIKRDGREVAYIRVRSYAHIDYHNALKDILETSFVLADTPEHKTPLILDIRGGWGGASPSYMDIFNPVAPDMTFITRTGEEHRVQPSWKGPAAMLIDDGSRSGKEVLAYAFKKHHVGVLVGQKTAGMVLGGTCRPLSDGSLLYIAVQNVKVDGENLEGVGVEPDIKVDRELPYSQGKDPQVEAAVAALLKAK